VVEHFVRMDVSDQIYLLETSPILKYLLLHEKKKKVWVNTIYEDRERFGKFHTLFPKLLEQPVKFYEYMRMTPKTFFYVLEKIRSQLQKYSNFRICITPEEILVVTLR